MKFELPRLPFKIDALEPFISMRTLEFHYGKHHQIYINNLNDLVLGTKYENIDLETIIKVAEGPVFNNAAQVWNHTFYFAGLRPETKHVFKEPLHEFITEGFGSVSLMKDAFIKSSLSLFGSGWVWLAWNPKGVLEIIQENNAGNPLRKGLVPLLTCDVWEHAYYLDYQNRRIDYLNAFWTLINWELVEKRFNDARR